MISRRHQRGTTLVIALVMLVVLTLLVVSSIRSSTTNLRIVGNMKTQEEITAAAQQGIEQVMSTDFTATPTTVSVQVDINGDGTNDYTANVATPVCTGSRPLQNSDANIPNECISSGVAQNTGIFFASGVQATGTSWCAAQQWDIPSTVQAGGSGASVTIHQGTSMNVPAGTSC